MLYLFLIIKSVYWYTYYDLLFGANAIAYESTVFINPYLRGAFLLSVFQVPGLPLVFIVLVTLLSGLLLANRKMALRFSLPLNFLIWLLVLNLQNKIYPTLTGGNFLLNQFLFFNCFLSSFYSFDTSRSAGFKICLHNFAVLAIILQVCLAYFLSALAKWNDAGWRSGLALGTILSVDHYFLFHTGKPPFPRALAVFFNYGVMVYQFVFPFLFFFSKLKKPFLLLGILMHLYIAFVMGLVDFGLMMIVAYVYFWPFKVQDS